jgi:hypothetical protein
MLEVVRQKFGALPEASKSQVGTSGTIRSAFVEELAQELDISNEEVQSYLNIVVAAATQDLEALLDYAALGGSEQGDMIRSISSMDREQQFMDWHNRHVLLPQARAIAIRARMESGSTLESAEESVTQEELRSIMQMLLTKEQCFFPRPQRKSDKVTSVLISEVEDTLKIDSGLTKTQILKALGKDNITYREAADGVLSYLCFMHKVRKVGSKYYHITKSPHVYETEIHRRVYESVAGGSNSVSAIAKGIGYDNTRGRRRVEGILSLLESEGLVQTTPNNRYQEWSITI